MIDLRYDLTLSSVDVSIGRPYLRTMMGDEVSSASRRRKSRAAKPGRRTAARAQGKAEKDEELLTS